MSFRILYISVLQVNMHLVNSGSGVVLVGIHDPTSTLYIDWAEWIYISDQQDI